jgi:hypothetical protein
MNKLDCLINEILINWNPIGVDISIAKDEYIRYIHRIKESLNNEIELINCLEDILVNEMELEYDSNKLEHLKDVYSVCNRLMKISKW